MNNPRNPNQPKNRSIDPLVAQLEIRQKELGLNDGKFSRLLGISRPLWSMTRSGDRRVNVTLLKGITQAFPDLDTQILTFLRSKNE